MGLQLPDGLREFLNMIGYTWPEADEVKLMQMGQDWLAFAGRHTGSLSEADSHAQQVWTGGNIGDDIDTFRQAWSKEDSAKTNLEDFTTAAYIIGAGLLVCAVIVLALKINVIVQLVILAIQIAQAIATAAVTFGASLAEIPVFKVLTQKLIDMAINIAMNAVLGS